MKVADKSSDIVVKRPQPWSVFGRLDALESDVAFIKTSIGRLDALESDIAFIKTSISEIKMDQKMSVIMFIATQVPVWLMLLNK